MPYRPAKTGSPRSGTRAPTTAAAGGTGGGAVAALLAEGEGSALADLGRTLFGSVRIQGTGALEMGRKDFGLFTLQMDAHAGALHDRLEAQLADHMQLLQDGTPEELGDSYRRLKLWTFACRGGDQGIPPWNDPRYAAPVDDPRAMAAKSRRITDRTMDACAYLLAAANRYKANPDMLTGQYASYGIESFVDALAHYELYLYVYRSMAKAAQQLTALLHGAPQTGSSENAITAAAQAQFDDAMRQLRQQVGVEQNRVLAYLTAIDDFVPPNAPRSAMPGPGAAPSLPQPGISFPER
jgi:hypothetical protein